MKRTLIATRSLIATTALLSLALLTACGDDSGSVASDPAGNPGAPSGKLASTIPAAPGAVWGDGTVMDVGTGPQLCLGAIAESYPPQCSGPDIAGWDWSSYKGTFDKSGDIRWGSYHLTGTWDGATFTVTDALTLALYDPMPTEPVVPPTPEPNSDLDGWTDADYTNLSNQLTSSTPGGLMGDARDKQVFLTVFYDDGTFADYFDAQYGPGVVIVSSALHDA